MTLYRVTIEHTTYVLAESEDEACDIATSEAIRDEQIAATADEVQPGEDIAKSGWNPGSLPWGDGDGTLADVWPKS